MKVDRERVREQLRIAAQRLPTRDGDATDHECLIEQFVSTISGMSGGSEMADTREPRRAGSARVEDELGELVAHAKGLAEAITSASPATVQALWDAPSLRSADRHRYRIDVRLLLGRLSADAEHLSSIAKNAPEKRGDAQKVRGKRADLWAVGVIRTSAWHYERMTGREIDQSRRPDSFHVLLSEVFSLLGIDRSVERAVRDAKRKAWT